MGLPTTINEALRQREQRGGHARHHRGAAVFELSTHPCHLDRAHALEQRVWTECGYGDLAEEGYVELNSSSRAYTCFEDGECLGLARTFQHHPVRPLPFLDLPFWDPAQHRRLTRDVEDGVAEELGTAAVARDRRGESISAHLWRVAFRDARARGVRTWGIVMEPERVARMNRRSGFAFRQVGGAVQYQGGACASHVMSLDEAVGSMFWRRPLSYAFFVVQPLDRRPRSSAGQHRCDEVAARG